MMTRLKFLAALLLFLWAGAAVAQVGGLGGSTSSEPPSEAEQEAGPQPVVEPEGVDVTADAMPIPDWEEAAEAAESLLRRETATNFALQRLRAEMVVFRDQFLEDMDDVQKVYANFDIDEKELERLSG